MKTYKSSTGPCSYAGARLLAVLAATLGIGAASIYGQSFDTGSDGLLGDVVIATNTTIKLPPDGKLQYNSLKVNSGARVQFERNARNTPVHILAKGDIVIEGTIDVNGSVAPGGVPTGGSGGPGGFDGGKPGFGAEAPPGSGYGPGGGAGGSSGCSPSTDAGGGSFGSRFDGSQNGATYGSTFLLPIIGGSGGAGSTGQPGVGGGGGGGALLVASGTRITITGAVEAIGGAGRACLNSGSGGAIRLVAPRVEGTGRVDVRSSGVVGGHGGAGRIRVDTIDRSNLRLDFREPAVTTVGGHMIVFPPVTPRLDTIEVAGNPVPIGSGPVSFVLPFGSTPDRTVKIQARDFGRTVPIRVVLTPDSGTPVTADAEINNQTQNPATVEVPVKVPVNTQVTVHCWTK